MRKILILALSIFSFLTAFAQVDTEFWFAVPSQSTHSQNAEYHLVMFSSGSAANVTISMPANSSFSPIVTTIAKNGSKDLIIAADYATAQSQFAVPYDVISSKAICVNSDTKIYCYFHITHNNGEVYTLKGQKAKGTDFRVLSQSSMVNGIRTQYTDPYHSVEILATEDNTHVTITPTKNIGTACVSTPISITLNRGQTYAIRACSQDAIDHLFGTRITSDKAIIVNSTDDSVLATGGTGRDLVADQLTPIDLWGTEYIAMGHQIAWENLSITALENNTTVSLSNGSSITLNQGETQSVSMASQEVMYIHSNKVVGVFQVTGFQQESGGTNLPCLECTGSRVVKYKRLAMSLMTYVQIVTRTENISHFLLNGSVIPSSNFNNVAGTGGKYCYAIINVTDIVPTSSLVSVECTSGLFQMGVLDVDAADITKPTSATSCTYGYFSDYGTAHEYDEYATFAEGTTYTWKNHFLPGTTTPMTFTAEGVYTDNQLTDRNGCDSICILHLSKIPYPDNVADVECVVPPMPSNFEMKELFKTDGVHSMTTPMVADLDGDGQSEIICCKWPDAAKIFFSDGFLVIDGQTGDVIDTILTCQYPICGQPISIADVDGDGKCEIFLSDIDNYAYCYDYQGNLLWKTAFALDGTYIPLLGNLTDDNIPELLFGKYIFNPISGILIHEISFSSDGTGWGAPHGVGVLHRNYDPRAYHLGALSDVDHDGNLDYCAGNTIYKLNITNPNGQVGNRSFIYKQAESIASIHNYDGQTVVVDFDNDGIQDICVLGLPKDLALTSPQPEYDIYVWNSQTTQIIAHHEFLGVGEETADGTWTGQSIPYCGDLNGDGFVDLTFSAKGLAMYTYTYDATSPNHMRQVHNYAPFSETCGYTVFDFNMDGKSEIVYRGTHTLNIVDGTTLTPLSTPIEAFSGTVTEYPVVADVNKDGQAEIIICRGHIEWKSGIDRKEGVRGWVSVYGAMNSCAWSSARPVWNQWAYTSTCINDDMTVPQYQYDAATQFPNGKKPYNTFLSQVPIIDKQGDIFVPAADAAISTCSQSVVNDSVVITLKYCNNGDANLVAPYEITTYQNEYRGTIIQVDTVKEGLAINECKTITIKVPSLSVCKAAIDTAFIIAINDDGHGIAQHGNQQAECDTTNNTYKILLPDDLRRDTAYLNVTISQGESYIFDGHTYTTDTQDTATFVSAAGCDSICVLDLKVIPYPDNVDDATGCMVPPSINVWSIRQKVISEVGNIDDCGTTLCGDIDEDGQIEILAPIITEDVKFSKIGIFNSQAKAKRIIDVPTCSAFINIAIAKVKISDSDYKTLIFFLAYDRYIYAYDPNGVQFWKSDQQFTSHSGEAVAIASLSLADFNHDGWTEIYIGPEIFDAATGNRLAKYNGNKGHSDRAWKASRQSYQSVVADVLGDDKLELILGNTACSVNINSRTDESQNSITTANSVSAAKMKMEDNSNIPSTDGHTLLADMDGDGKLDVVVMHIDKTSRVIYVYVWNPRTGSMICTKKITNAAEFGTPNVGDIDHDGNLELNFIIGTYSGETTDANDKIYSLKYNKSTHNLEVFWTLHHDDASGSTGLSLFDFNQDGTMEIVYRDCEHLRIINGSRIHHLTGLPVAAPYDLANIPCTSGTGVEYPVIADVDADGEAEIVVVGNGSKLVIYESDLAPWAPARSVWNQFAYNLTNVNEDLTIPTYLYNNAHIFTDVSSTTRQPFNNFLAQTTTINTQGVPFIAAADVNVSTTTTATYENDSIKIDISFCNQGDLHVNAPYCITVYKNAYRGSVLFVDTIKAILPIGDCLSHQVGFPISEVCSDKDINTIVIAVNDDGHGIAQHGKQQAECDTTNNRTTISLPTDFRSDTTKYTPVICATELPYTFTPTGTIFPVGSTSGRTIIPETNKYGCDSIIAIDLTVNPILYGDTMASTYDASYTWHGNIYTSSGDYPITITSKVTGCDSIVTLHLKMLSYSEDCYSTEGTEFYVAFMYNDLESQASLKLFATSRYGATMTISNPLMGWSTNISVPANGSNEVTIPANYCYPTTFEQALNKGLVVTSTAPISLFASNATEPTPRDWDATNILPVENLSSRYVVQALPVLTASTTFPGRSEFVVLATEDNTTININLTAKTSTGRNPGSPYQIALNRGQIYQVFGSTASSDFSGTTIDAHGKKIAVFNGTSQTPIPTDKKSADHLYEQAIPLEKLGTKFAITATSQRQKDMVRVTAVSNSTDVFVDGVKMTTINAHQSYDYMLDAPKTSCYIETSKQSVCYLYLTSHNVNNQFRSNMGDPAMVAVYPIEQTTDYITFSTVSTSQDCEQYVNIVTRTDNISEMSLDGTNISSSFTNLSGNNTYSFARLSIVEGSHTISSSGSGFLGHVYGIARVESYAYNLGTTLCEQVDYHLDGDTTKLVICQGDDFEWNGLSPTSTGLYEVYLTSQVTGFDSLCVLDLTVNPTLTGDTSATFCNGTPFMWHGTPYATGGDYPYTYTSKVAPYCDSIVTLHLTQLEPTDSVENVMLCAGDSHTWHGQTFTSSTTITETIPNAAGCDSVCTLNLTILPTLTGDTTATFCNGTPFIWHGTSYAIGGDYPYTYTSKVAPYCDSIVTLHLTQLEPTDSVEVVTICAGGSHTWHGHIYTTNTTVTETIDNAVGCDSVCTLKLTVLPQLTGDTSATFCNGTPFMWHGTPYATGGNYPYTYTSKVAPYCDSIVTLHLTQLEPTDSVENVTLCYGESHVWHGQTFTTSTTITETIPNAAGCDSVCTLNLTILPALTGDTSATFCNGTPFMWHDTPYATGGDYQYTYTSKVAPYCDSIVTLHLTQLEPTDSIEVVTICYGGSHTWHGHTYTATTTTTETIDNAVGCDSVCTLKLTVLPAITGDTNMTVCDTLLPVTWRGQSITGAGEYYHTATAYSGCDSTITLHVTVETCLPPSLTCDTLEATLIVPDICADDDSMYIDITYTKGLPVSYNVTFGADAVAQGFQSSYTGNVRVTSSTTASISIPIPNDPTNRQVYPKPNVYSIDISILDTCDAYTTWRSQNFLIHYPSWLTLQRWNDVISLYNERYNGGYVFSQIRWFHEGTLLESRGDHDGYIYQRPTLVYGDAYWAELTRADDGVTITTCPIYPVPMTDSTKMDDVTDPYIIVTPTVVTPSNPTVTVKTNICGEYYVYYVDGHLLDKQNFCPKDNHTFTIDIDPCYVRTGLYILVFYGEEGTIKAVKLLVEP